MRSSGTVKRHSVPTPGPSDRIVELAVERLDAMPHSEQSVRLRRLDPPLVDSDAVVAHDDGQLVVLHRDA